MDQHRAADGVVGRLSRSLTRVDGQWRFSQRRYDRLYATAPRELEVYPFPSASAVDDPFAKNER